MKFKKIEPLIAWSEEYTLSRIDTVFDEISIFNQEVDKLNRRIGAMIEERMVIRRKISNKQKYINQLKEQLKVNKNTENENKRTI